MSEIDFRNALKKINSKGFIKSLRSGDTGIGFTLETELEIVENNLQIHDLSWKGEPIELKAQRKTATSNITLFTKEGIKGDYGDVSLLKKYGYSDVEGKTALRITLTTKDFNPQGFKLVIDKTKKTVNLIHKTDGLIWYYTIQSIMEKLGKKLSSNLLLVFADSKKEGVSEYFHFNEAYFLSKLSDNNFIKLLDEGKLVVEFRMFLRDNGTARNHGTGFRLNERYLKDLYEKMEKIL